MYFAPDQQTHEGGDTPEILAMANATANGDGTASSNGNNHPTDTSPMGAPVADDEMVRAPAARYVRRRVQPHIAPEDKPTELSATEIENNRKSLGQRVRGVLIGKPIPTEEAMHERIGVFKALAILSSDALSSVAYGTEASLAVLVTAGVAVSQHNVVLGLTVVLLLAAVAFSYRQTIFHYQNGGGSYIVAKDNLNVHFGLIAAAALLIDYVLTVSVSVSAGVDALVSTFGALARYSVFIGVALIVVLVVMNLRGVRESGKIFAAPTYVFVGSFLVMELVGVVRALLTGGLFAVVPPHYLPPAGGAYLPFAETDKLGIFLLLTAFASGCSAMTGTEAISNGVPIFKAPQAQNAAKTLTIMALLLGVMYAGTTYLAWRFGVLPYQNSNPTIISQLATLFFSGPFAWFVYLFNFSTTLILVLAANTSFADFPRLSSILARDSFLPHFFSMQGDRLVFNTGILVLGVLSAILLVVFHGNTDALINLYALGVFVAFTLSQSGMVKRWLRPPHPPNTPMPPREVGWMRGMLINLTGALATGVVAVIIAVAKFDRGAWVVVILVPLLYAMFQGIHHHYEVTAKLTRELHVERPAAFGRHIVVVPIARIDSLSLRGLAYARALSRFVLAVHVATSEEEAEAVRHDWQKRVKHERFLRGGPANDLMDDADQAPLTNAYLTTPITGPELIIVDSPYRALARPIIDFVDRLRANHPNDLITVVLPEFVPTHFWENLLHNQTVLWLKLKLLTRPTIVTVSVPYRLVRTPRAPKAAAVGAETPGE
jgi:amino acid transporter